MLGFACAHPNLPSYLAAMSLARYVLAFRTITR